MADPSTTFPTNNDVDIPASARKEILALHIMANLTIQDRSSEFESRVRGFLSALGRKPIQEDIECAAILSDEGAMEEWLSQFKETFGRVSTGGGGAEVREEGESGAPSQPVRKG
ncbi:hypothetical protein LTR86_005367 [Recurvomyces mirabilis]|nr:hypothetical protein LTR86_005367 [Recurvomyces mirabilis]